MNVDPEESVDHACVTDPNTNGRRIQKLLTSSRNELQSRVLNLKEKKAEIDRKVVFPSLDSEKTEFKVICGPRKGYLLGNWITDVNFTKDAESIRQNEIFDIVEIR